MFEHRKEPLLSKPEYYRRVIRSFCIGGGIIAGSLFLGILGYHYLEGFGWLDSLLNASMILGGMGPVGEMHTRAGKLFASFYALFSGVIFISAVGVMFAPVYHRFIHKFHLELEDDKEE